MNRIQGLYQWGKEPSHVSVGISPLSGGINKSVTNANLNNSY